MGHVVPPRRRPVVHPDPRDVGQAHWPRPLERARIAALDEAESGDEAALALGQEIGDAIPGPVAQEVMAGILPAAATSGSRITLLVPRLRV